MPRASSVTTGCAAALAGACKGLRLPHAVFTVCLAAACVQVAYNPKALAVYSRLNGACDIIVQDSSSFCGRGERLSFAELQLRTQAVDQVGRTAPRAAFDPAKGPAVENPSRPSGA